MKRQILSILLTTLMLLQAFCVYAEDNYKKFDIKFGMHKRVVDKVYGQPLLVEKKGRFSPISKKKALYEIDESNFMILHFFSGRIYKITLLEDMGFDEARSIFEKD